MVSLLEHKAAHGAARAPGRPRRGQAIASPKDDAELAAAIKLFNKGSYLAAHEVLDDLWEATSGPEADFYKGLIQASIAMYKLGEGSLDGASSLHRGQRKLLARFLPSHRGWDVAAFLLAMRGCFDPLTSPETPQMFRVEGDSFFLGNQVR